MKIQIRRVTESDAKNIATWKFDGIYCFYDNDRSEGKKEWAMNLDKDESAFGIYNETNELIGNCCFDRDEDDKEVSFGIQMRPDLTGKGIGKEILEVVLEFGREKYNLEKINLLVVKFNERAIKVYKRLGFKVTEEFVWNVNGGEYEFLAMEMYWE
ncbi:MAG: GNAT family N-acetyltransferase [Clostridium sp.]|uniref:GNAT family N-acetyltransferase n=1 Tax=Clostridium sp. TaxID=1506 RepID=UPI003055F9D9